MDIVSPVLDIFSRLWTCSAHNTDYVCKLRQNLITLETSFNKLRCKRDDINERIGMAESSPAEPAKRTNVVSDWLQRVHALDVDVQKILNDKETIKNEGGCYFCCWGRKNCWSAYKLGKLVSRKQIAVECLLMEGNFQDVTYRCQPDPLQQIPTVEVVGMDAKLNEVLELLVNENDVGIVGLYGMGGVGKSTILNKINNEFSKRNYHFNLVFRIVVSQDLNIINIQNQIGRRLGISWSKETEIYERANDIFKVLKNKKFLLLLDDIWEEIRLETIGFSKDTLQITGSKVVFATRDKQVCGFMEADRKIKIECLDEDQAWSLFQQKVKQEALSCHPDVPEVAKKVAKECRGLPLALITIGRTMSSKTDLPQWQHALHTLQESASQFSGMADKVLAIMKYSYDYLENRKLKSCFLYCSLYPEDYSIYINELIAVWIGQGFLDNTDDFVKARNEGLDVIRRLKDACLLEIGFYRGVKINYFVKMHDVVRDLAIWVTSDLGRKKGTHLTLQAQSTLKLHDWEKAKRISLIGNRAIKKLYGEPHCSNLSILLLRDSSITVISDEFFRFMPMLQVLSMYAVKLKKPPTSMFSLQQLQSLYMPEYDEDVVLPPGSLACLPKLKILCLSESCCHWEIEGGQCLRELESLPHLIGLQITIATGLALQRLVTSPKLQLCTKFLTIKYCPGVTSLTLSPSLPSSSMSLLNLVHLIRIELQNCEDLEELRIMEWDKVTLLTTLKTIYIFFMPKLRIVWDVPHQSFCSWSLKHVAIKGCPRLKDVTWLIYAKNLETLFLVELDGLTEVISNEFSTEEKLISTFSRLSHLILGSLRSLKTISAHNVNFFLLEKIYVVGCPELKKLPFNTSSMIPRTIETIEGEKLWWERLEWEDEATKLNLAPYFREINFFDFNVKF